MTTTNKALPMTTTDKALPCPSLLMTKTAWIFPGQGSQKIGMGADLLALSKDKFAAAEEILGWSVTEICQSQEDKLSRTLYTQPCLYVVESILADLLQAQEQPDLVCGHSLGEYIALYVAGVFDWASGLRLVKRRAELMDSATGGMMVAFIGFDREELLAQIQQTPDVVVLANDNSAAQVVISGTPDAVETVRSHTKAKRAVRLNVSGAFHSPLMATAALEFQQVLESVVFNHAQIPVVSNVEPIPTTDSAVLKANLTRQMTGSVRWRETCERFPAEGIERVIEIGPGNVLTGLIKRTCPAIIGENISTAADIATYQKL